MIVAEEIAEVPVAPPSILSKKLIELHIPTIHKIVIIASTKLLPVGFPKSSARIINIVVIIPKNVCAINLESALSPLKSSTKPTIANVIAGPKIDIASKKFSILGIRINMAVNETIVTPKTIAIPPKYGIGTKCDLCAELGKSYTLLLIAIFLTTGVKNPTNSNVDKKSIIK